MQPFEGRSGTFIDDPPFAGIRFSGFRTGTFLVVLVMFFTSFTTVWAGAALTVS